MGIWCYRVWNVGSQRAEVYCLRNVSARVLESDNTQTPDWCIGYQDDHLPIVTFRSEKQTWWINDGYWEMLGAVSIDRGSRYREVGVIKILKNYGRFNVWICNDCIVIENEDYKLGRPSDVKSLRFFLVTEGGTTESNDQAYLINCMLD